MINTAIIRAGHLIRFAKRFLLVAVGHLSSASRRMQNEEPVESSGALSYYAEKNQKQLCRQHIERRDIWQLTVFLG